MAGLLLLSGLLAAGANVLRPSPLPWVRDLTPVRQVVIPSEDRISVQMAMPLLDRPDVLFVDARPAADYAERHIAGARSLPYDPFGSDLDKAIGALPTDRVLVIYCSADGCPLSEELAKTLTMNGFKNVKVLLGGIEAWAAEAGPMTEKKP